VIECKSAFLKRKCLPGASKQYQKHLIDYSERSEITVLPNIIFDQKFLKKFCEYFEINTAITL